MRRARRAPPFAHRVPGIELALRQGATALTRDLAALLAAFEDTSDSLRERVAAVARRTDELLAQGVTSWPTLAGAIERVSALVDSLPSVPDSETWRQLGDAYDALVAALPADATEPRPTNLHRASFHMGSAVAGLLATLVVFDTPYLPFAAGTLAAIAWTLEILRRRSPALNETLMRGFGRIARPGEADRVNSGTWYLTALVVLTLTFSPLLCVVSVAVLGFADPAAALVGRRLGRTPLRLGRTLEGTLAFVVVGTLAAMLVMQLLPVVPAAAVAWPVAVVAAIGGALAELYSRRVDDNLSIPLAAMASAWAALAILGASPW